MNNTGLDRRIATEFMGWELSLDGTIWCQDGECLRDVEDFSPTTDIKAAYVVLEKIASKLDVSVEKRPDTNWGAYFDDDHGRTRGAEYDELPLAISKLAKKIMDTPEYMALFKGE